MRSHAAEVPVLAILAALPTGSVLSGMWLQHPTDDTNPSKPLVRLSVQYRYPEAGVAWAEDGIGPTVNAAGTALIGRLRERYLSRAVRPEEPPE